MFNRTITNARIIKKIIIEIYTVRNIILEHQKVKAYANILYNGTITLSYYIITGNF